MSTIDKQKLTDDEIEEVNGGNHSYNYPTCPKCGAKKTSLKDSMYICGNLSCLHKWPQM